MNKCYFIYLVYSQHMVHMACKHKHMYMYILNSLKLMRYLLTMQHFGS